MATRTRVAWFRQLRASVTEESSTHLLSRAHSSASLAQREPCNVNSATRTAQALVNDENTVQALVTREQPSHLVVVKADSYPLPRTTAYSVYMSCFHFVTLGCYMLTFEHLSTVVTMVSYPVAHLHSVYPFFPRWSQNIPLLIPV